MVVDENDFRRCSRCDTSELRVRWMITGIGNLYCDACVRAHLRKLLRLGR